MYLSGWDDVKVFLAAFRTNSLRGASIRLSMDQTTVSRRLTNLEKQLGAKLFYRTPDGLVPTEVAERVLGIAQEMERNSVSFLRLSEGSNGEFSGDVSIATTDRLAVEFLMSAVKILRDRYPNINVTMKLGAQMADMSRGEAEIAVRTQRPVALDLIAKRLGGWDVGLYATQTYLDKFGLPKLGQHLANHDIALYENKFSSPVSDTMVGESRRDARVVARLTSSFLLTTFVRSGMALGELPCYQELRYPELIRIWPDKTRKKKYEVWKVVHKDAAELARVKAVSEVISEVFERDIKPFIADLQSSL
ncbi:LysR family transcriptional regulator [Providencia rettgeri]|uniref:LysR family transcriptional regulator n=1 Tax=Providencia rettgeri TaxID=587 RepID=UPI001183D0A5|nr:LysR family transcriptional regulator [Providencia rettgeri]